MIDEIRARVERVAARAAQLGAAVRAAQPRPAVQAAQPYPAVRATHQFAPAREFQLRATRARRARQPAGRPERCGAGEPVPPPSGGLGEQIAAARQALHDARPRRDGARPGDRTESGGRDGVWLGDRTESGGRRAAGPGRATGPGGVSR